MQILKDGPIIVEGPLTLHDTEGNEISSHGSSVAICRCGKSANKPFCDGRHKDAEFKGVPYTVKLIRK